MSSWDHVLPHAGSLTEFGRFNGDCMWDAMLAGLHTLDPVKWPLDIAVLNNLVELALSQGRTCKGTRNGCATMSAIKAALHDWYSLNPVYELGYANPLPWDEVHLALTHYAGINPILMEIAHGGTLPDNERGVDFHGIALLAHTFASGLYGAANGDSSTAKSGVLSIYHWTHIKQAVPVAVLVLPAPVPAPQPAPLPTDGDIVGVLTDLAASRDAITRAMTVLQREVYE